MTITLRRICADPYRRQHQPSSELRRRIAIEPVIGHLKSDGKLERHWLHGTHGDAVNVVLVAAGHNIRLILAWLRIICAVIQAALSTLQDPRYAHAAPAARQ